MQLPCAIPAANGDELAQRGVWAKNPCHTCPHAVEFPIPFILMKQYVISIIQPQGYVHSGAFTELAELIVHGIKGLGINAELKWNTIEPGTRNILIGIHLLDPQHIPQVPSDTILVNTEQLSDVFAHWNVNLMKWFHAGFEVWDYSDVNIKYLRAAGVAHVKKLGIGYASALRRIRPQAVADIDVLFYGALNPRRIAILEGLDAKGLAVKSLFGVYGSERDAWISRSKIVLNLHQFDSKIFEVVRVFYLLTNSVAVVAEVNQDTNIEAHYKDGIAHASYSGIVDLVCELAGNTTGRQKLQERGFETISKFPQSHGMRELLDVSSDSIAVPSLPSANRPMKKQRPKPPTALFQEAFRLHQSGRLLEAAQGYQAVLAESPKHFDALQLLGAIALQNKQFVEALAWLDEAIAIEPNNPVAHCNRGVGLQHLQRYPEALASYSLAIQHNPDYFEAHRNKGDCLRISGYFEDAVQSYRRAVVIRSKDVATHFILGEVLRELKQYEAALASLHRAFALEPHFPFLRGSRMHTRAYLCDWHDFDAELNVLKDWIGRGEPVISSFALLALTDSPQLQQQAANTLVRKNYPARSDLGAIPQRPNPRRIRLGYFSADFHNHATTYLMAELFEQHDRSKFELIAFSFGPVIADRMRQRICSAFDRFIDIREHSDRETAELSRALCIDIAVDLKGHTADNRLGIFAYRAAPIQVSYLGYPGTLGADYIDYVIADPTVIPEASRTYFTEKVAYLPHCYQVNDRKREIADTQFTRAGSGLPPTGFVYCCFNSNYKITPRTLDSWIRILHRVKGSVLWLLEDSQITTQNLRKEVEKRGIDSQRLLFARRVPLPEHLARHRLADLFLDTLPYNAHTTASDALWSGLPVVTCLGESFASRVAASLLNSIGLPELITHTSEAFESLAVELALNPARLEVIRSRLANNRLTTPLFDSQLFARHVEDAYLQMVQRQHAGMPPDHLTVDANVGCQQASSGIWNRLCSFFRPER